VRKVVSGRVPLAIVAALLFPLPYLSPAFFTSGFRGVEMVWTRFADLRFAVPLSSWLVATAAIGWCLATLRPNHAAQDATTG